MRETGHSSLSNVGQDVILRGVWQPVVLVNSDRIDKLSFIRRLSFGPVLRALLASRSLISDPRRPPVGDPRLAPSDRCPTTLGQAPQTDRRGPLSLGVSVLGLERLGIARFHRQGRHGDWLAAEGLWSFLELEDSPRETWPPDGAETDSGVDLHAEPRKPTLGWLASG